MTTSDSTTAKIPVVVTTEHRGVFFGFMNPDDKEKTVISLSNAQMCIRWSAACHGVLGLAASGPKPGSRIGEPVQAVTLQAVTAVMEASPEAVAAWQAQPWEK